jgi:hypothetical protein
MKNLKELVSKKLITVQSGNSIIKSYIGWDLLSSEIEEILNNLGYQLKSDFDEDRGMCYFYQK